MLFVHLGAPGQPNVVLRKHGQENCGQELACGFAQFACALQPSQGNTALLWAGDPILQYFPAR